MSKDFKKNIEAYYKMKPKLLKEHKGKFLAFRNGKFAGVHSDKNILKCNMRKTYGRSAHVLIKRLDKEEPQFLIRTRIKR